MHSALAVLMVFMSTFDETLHPRGQAENAGQFRVKANTAPADALCPISVTPENTRYTLLVDGQPHTTREPGARAITVRSALDGMPQIAGSDLSLLAAGAPASNGENWTLRAEGVGQDGQVELWEEVAIPPVGHLLVVEHDGGFMTISDLDERGLTLFDVETHDETIIMPRTDYPEEPVELENVREWLTVAPGDGPAQVELVFQDDEPSTALIDIHTYENFLWQGDEFTGDELSEHLSIVEDVYREWFGAEIDVYDDWDNVRVTLSSKIDRHRATNLLILEQAHSSYAKFRAETDPGSFGSPYVGKEIRRRIDEAVAAQEVGLVPA